MKIVTGVMLFLFSKINNKPHILVLKELKSKPEAKKFAGMLSVPAESSEPFDNCLCDTTNRMIIEEIDGSGSALRQTKIHHISEEPVVVRFEIVTIKAHYAWGIFNGHPDEIKCWSPKDNDIELIGWMTIEELMSQYIRAEIAPIFTAITKSGEWQRAIDQLNKQSN